MGIWLWIQNEGFDLLEALGLIGGLFYTGWSIHRGIATHRVSNLLALTQANREIRSLLAQVPNRLLDAHANIKKNPITDKDRHLVSIIVQHYFSTFYLALHDRFVNPAGLEKDIHWFFSFPVPAAVWGELAEFQRKDFRDFIEEIAFD